MTAIRYPAHTWADPRLYVSDSAINGQGIFCSADIAAGECLMIWGGVPVRKSTFDEKVYRFQTIVPISEEEYLALPVTDQSESIDEYLNHSCDPNAWLADEVHVVARRDIRSGEEITVDAATWDDGTIKEYAAGGVCTCGSPQCRRILRADDWKRPELQRAYAGHFSPFLQDRMRGL